MPAIIYIHGFLSSPSSFKAEATKAWLAEQGAAYANVEFYCPQLSSYPETAERELRECLAGIATETVYAIGSSLGGFWASYLLEQGLLKKAVLVNPAVSPHTRFTNYIGQELKSYYSDERYRLQASDMEYLARCESLQLKDASCYWLMAQKGDEVLDYRMAEARYQGAKLSIEAGGNHSFVAYERWLPEIMQFFELP